jgi:hypothetical protein
LPGGGVNQAAGRQLAIAGLSHTQCYIWYQRFKSGRTSTEDDLKTEWPSTSTDDYHVEKRHAAIRENCHLTVCEVSEEVSISKSSCHTILTKNWRCIVFLQTLCHVLRNEQKANHVTLSQELFDHSNADKNLLKNVIIGDETWVYGYDIETKSQSSPQPKSTP